MEREIKFTTDGRKVVVIGSLNSQEKIVQEIFISGGVEIPSGENFVVKSLHDEPVVSWKETKTAAIEKAYNETKAKYNTDTEFMYKKYRTKASELSGKLDYMGKALKNVSEDSFKTLVDYITGEIKWIIVNNYRLELLPIEKFNQLYENKLRLISIFGKDDGSMTYAVGDYYDYSGGHKSFIPFNNYIDAYAKFKELLIADGINDHNLKLADEFGIYFPKEDLDKYYSNQRAYLEKNITAYKSEIKKWETMISEIGREKA